MNQIDSYLIRCASCRTKNRIPSDKAGMIAKCGKCGSSINTEELLIDNVVIVTDEDFDKWVIRSPLPVLIDCWAPWCGPCKMIAPIVEEIAAAYEGKATICKLNTDDARDSAMEFGISAIPTLILFKDGHFPALGAHLMTGCQSAWPTTEYDDVFWFRTHLGSLPLARATLL